MIRMTKILTGVGVSSVNLNNKIDKVIRKEYTDNINNGRHNNMNK
jgi:hypothetical protein